jgi:hypothetical protein
MNPKTQKLRFVLIGLLLALSQIALASEHAPTTQSRVFEWTFESQKVYPDPFNDVDVDVIFAKGSDSWRVPTFWRGGSKWTVRFAAPTPGEYTYRLESTDASNPDLNGHEGRVTITAYQGPNLLLKRGMLRVSANKRYFEQADGTPFYWLGDTWWSGMSTRLSWEGFQKLTADRKAKGFTVVQIVAGLVPGEEQSPSDPGYCNEGGCVWNPGFKQINPKFFDFADQRVQHLVDSEIAPAIVGAWSEKVGELGVAKLKKHWRYVIARYGAYPVFWIVGGEVSDPPGKSPSTDDPVPGGWTEIARYLRATDPYHHPITVHEVAASTDLPLQDESLTDFHLFQPSHADWSSIAVEVAQLDLHYARTDVTKPLVVGEIGYERLGGEPHPEWLSQPRGTTLFEPRAGENNKFRIGVQANWGSPEFNTTPGPDEWKEHNGNFRLPYAAGVPREVRFIYVPSFGLLSPPPPTILGLEPGVRYHAYYWEPSYGIKFDLGAVEAPLPGAILRREKFEEAGNSAWSGNLLNGVNQKDLAASVGVHSDAEAGLVLRFHDAGNYVAAVYSPKEKTVYLLDRKDGVDGKPLAATPIPVIATNLRLSAEVRGGWVEVSVTDGQHTYSSEIVSVSNTAAGGAGLLHKNDGATLELRQSPTLVTDTHLEKKLYDAQGNYRGELVGPGMDLGPPFGAPTSWDDFGKEKILLLDSYRPERLPAAGDWVLVLENQK